VTATGYKTLAERSDWSLVGGEGSAKWEWKHRVAAEPGVPGGV